MIRGTAGFPDAFDAELYGGADLARAAERSTLLFRGDRHFNPALPSVPNALGALRKVIPAKRSVTGVEALSGAPMCIAFRGRLSCIEFCARHILGTARYAVRPAGAREPDVIVFDHPLAGIGRQRDDAVLRVPAWLAQRVRLAGRWDETLRSLPRKLTKEIARQLRRHAFTASLVNDLAAKRDFYHRLYVPYAQRRFGRAAVLRSERAFLREVRGEPLLQLRFQGEPVGATVLAKRGATLKVGQTALSLDHEISGRSEVLDYFSLLLAQLLGCTSLDLGLSRSHVEDGVFRYKSKWRAELSLPSRLKLIRIQPLTASPATLGFLSRNGFIERRGGRFVVRRLDPNGAARVGPPAGGNLQVALRLDP